MRLNAVSRSNAVLSKSTTTPRLVSRRYSRIARRSSCRKSSTVAKSDTLRGRNRSARANSVRALNQFEKWLRSP
jgi:hypothetical protein